MGGLPAVVLSLAVAVGAPPESRPAKEPGRPLPGGDLSAEDAAYLEALIGEFLFDPRGATRVRLGSPDDPTRGTHRYGRFVFDGGDFRDGWLVRGRKGEPDRVFFADGESIPAPGRQLRQLDFEALCERRYGRQLADENELARLVYRHRLGGTDDGDLANAAWLHRRGYNRLAARALAAARAGNDDPRDELRDNLAHRAYGSLIEAFCGRADADALAHGERLFRLYPDVAAEKLPQAEELVADLKRRQRAGTFGKPPARDWPAGFAGWPVEQRVSFLVESLDEIEQGPATAWDVNLDLRLDSDRLDSDRRIAALVALGDVAVPALIEAIDRDERLVRHRVRRAQFECGLGLGSARERAERVVTVRTTVEGALRSILKVRHYDPTGPEQSTDDSPAATADRLRRYWAAYGRLPFPDRMMALLNDPAVHPAARQDAADSLVSAFPADRDGWTRRDRRDRTLPARPSPLAFRYRSPSVAEAILAALDRDRAASQRTQPSRQSWDGIEGVYLDQLVALGDPRVAPELARRAEAGNDPGSRMRFAAAAHTLGVSGPMVRLAREVEAGTVRMPPVATENNRRNGGGNEAVEELVDALIDARLPEADAAMYALARPEHPFYPLVEQAVLRDPRFIDNRVVWKRHPLCVTVLRHGLTDTRPTGGHYYLRGDEIEERLPARRPAGGRLIPPADRAEWAEHAEARVADEAADRLSSLVVGLPEYHPLRRDADQVLAATRAILDCHAGRLRPLTPEEDARWGDVPSDAYVPDIRPLGRPATAADVRAGRAVFDLGGTGKVAEVKMPAWLVLKADAKQEDAPGGLIVQAEVGADGKVVYGVIFRHAIRAVKAEEVGRIESYATPGRSRDSSRTLEFERFMREVRMLVR